MEEILTRLSEKTENYRVAVVPTAGSLGEVLWPLRRTNPCKRRTGAGKMKCQICGQDIPDNSKFCAKCGARIPRCPTCGKVLTKRIRFCANDGTPIPEEALALIPAPLPAAAQADNQPVAAQDTVPSERTNPDRQTPDTQKANPSDSPAQSQEVQSGQAPDTNLYSEAAPSGEKKKGKARIVVIVCIISFRGSLEF